MENILLKPTFLESDRVFLKELDTTHVSDDYVRWMNDPTVVEFMESRFNQYTRENLVEYIEIIQKCKKHLFFAIIVKEDQKHIGNIKLGPVNLHHMTADIGILIGDKNYWGKGLAGESVKLICDYALNEWKLAKVTAGCYSNNLGSRRVFEKLGFSMDGIRKYQYQYKNKRVDELLFSKSNSNL